MTKNVCLVLFRNDLRVLDNPALYEASEIGTVLPVYIFEDEKNYPSASAQHFALYHSLIKLNQSLGGHLHFYKGNIHKIVEMLCHQHNITHVFWNRGYDPWRIQEDSHLKEWLKQKNIFVKSFNASLLFEPFFKSDGTPYKVFTPFYNACLKLNPARSLLKTPNSIEYVKENKTTINDLNIQEDWQKKWNNTNDFGEEAAHKTLYNFLNQPIFTYKQDRDYPSIKGTSNLAMHLALGTISVLQIYSALKAGDYPEAFSRQLIWREFAYHLLFHYPKVLTEPFQQKFKDFPWQNKNPLFDAWKNGKTGYPIIDAGMRELWQTGYMHNRVRMIVASFLTKNLMIHWIHGANWFFDCLFDADIANNIMGWQWVAGCGVDAAPYFRVFNPITQAKKFDPEGTYIKRFIPELKNLPLKYLFEPSTTPDSILKSFNIQLGATYPYPIIDISKSRNVFLENSKFSLVRPE